jgi:hypothetical protein
MTINLADNNPRIAYTVAQGATQQTFAVPFEFFNDPDISVYVDGVLKTQGTHYTLTGGDGSTGNVVFVTATPPAVQQVLGATGGSRVVIFRATPLERTSDFSAGADINRAALNEQLDILTAMIADEDDRIDRSITLNPYDLSATLTLPTDRASKVLAFDASGNVTNGPTVANVINADAYAAAAAASAASALSSQNSATSSQASATSSAASATSSQTAAAASAAAASTSETAAAASQSSATSSASAASTSATNAASSASAASTSASNASSSASSASTSASNASAAQTAAESARDATLLAYDNFDDRYLGAKASDPTLDNDGNALLAGSLYFNSVSQVMKLYTGSAWVAAYVSGVASSIGFTPAGNIAAVTVQAAIEELDAEKVIKTSSTGSAVVPASTQANRDASPAAGYFRFNTDLGKFEGYSGSAWGSVGGGATGGGADEVFVQNGQTMTSNYTIPAAKNAMSTGPITINSGVTLTVSSGARYVVI